LNFHFAHRAFFHIGRLHPLLDARLTEVVHARSGSQGVRHDGEANGALELTCDLVLDFLLGGDYHDACLRLGLESVHLLSVLLLRLLKKALSLLRQIRGGLVSEMAEVHGAVLGSPAHPSSLSLHSEYLLYSFLKGFIH
jgi:hypothetical protein